MLHARDPDTHYGVRISLAELSVFDHGAAEMVLAMPRKVRVAMHVRAGRVCWTCS